MILVSFTFIASKDMNERRSCKCIEDQMYVQTCSIGKDS